MGGRVNGDRTHPTALHTHCKVCVSLNGSEPGRSPASGIPALHFRTRPTEAGWARCGEGGAGRFAVHIPAAGSTMSLLKGPSRAMRVTGAFAIPGRRLRRPGRPRVAPLATLLGFALLIVGVLTYQAQDAARSHRGAAERALHDYASFAMWELSREATRELLAAMVA